MSHHKCPCTEQETHIERGFIRFFGEALVYAGGTVLIILTLTSLIIFASLEMISEYINAGFLASNLKLIVFPLLFILLFYLRLKYILLRSFDKHCQQLADMGVEISTRDLVLAISSYYTRYRTFLYLMIAESVILVSFILSVPVLTQVAGIDPRAGLKEIVDAVSDVLGIPSEYQLTQILVKLSFAGLALLLFADDFVFATRAYEATVFYCLHKRLKEHYIAAMHRKSTSYELNRLCCAYAILCTYLHLCTCEGACSNTKCDAVRDKIREHIEELLGGNYFGPIWARLKDTIVRLGLVPTRNDPCLRTSGGRIVPYWYIVSALGLDLALVLISFLL